MQLSGLYQGFQKVKFRWNASQIFGQVRIMTTINKSNSHGVREFDNVKFRFGQSALSIKWCELEVPSLKITSTSYQQPR